jgi:hypothetical protein
LQSALGNRDASLHQRPHLLGLGDRRDDPTSDLGRANLVNLRLAFSQHQRRGKIAEQSPLMGGAAAEHTTFATMAHDENPSTDENCYETGWNATIKKTSNSTN